jgi:hypothetical protein
MLVTLGCALLRLLRAILGCWIFLFWRGLVWG